MPPKSRSPKPETPEKALPPAKSSEILAAMSLAQEVAHAPLGDKRRQERFRDIVLRLVQKPDASIPVAIEDEAEQEAYYRLMRSEAVDHFKLLEPHLAATQARCEGLDAVLVAHDTTEFAFDIHDEPARAHLGRLSANRQGFFWHASLALSADGLVAPLGLVASRPFVHASQLEGVEEEEKAKDYWKAQGGILDNEQGRWLTGVEEAEARLKRTARVIHVMDREGDDYLTLFPMVVAGYGFVVRMCAGRQVHHGPRRQDAHSLEEHLAQVSWAEQVREVDLSARPARAAKKSHPQRRARAATLALRASPVTLRRPDHIEAEMAPGRIDVNVVEVLEQNPLDGEEPVRWLLVTDQPIDTHEACWQVVDHYRARWMVEEYFKALKTGAAYTSLQHRQARTLLAALAPKAIVAWHLLVLRHLSRALPDAPAHVVVNPVQLAILRHQKPKLIPPNPTAKDALAAVASLGGHIKNNGPPGWLVLGRGYLSLLEMERGFRVAQAMMAGGEM